MLVRTIVLFSVVGMLSVACGDKEDTKSDTIEVVDSGSSDTSSEE